MFEVLILQTFAQDFAVMIGAIGGIVVAIGSLALGVLNRTGNFENKQTLTDAVKFMITFGQKTVESKAEFATFADVFYKLSPEEQKKFLEQARPVMQQVREGAEVGQEQLDRLKPILIKQLGPEADPDNDASLPR